MVPFANLGFEHSEDPLGYSAYFASSFVSHSCGARLASRAPELVALTLIRSGMWL